MSPVATGVLAVLLYTGLIAAADGIVKLMAGGFAPAQLFALSGLLVAGFCVIAGRLQGHPDGLRTNCKRAMLLRSGATVLSCTSFFFAFRYLALAEVFVFIALMPLMAAMMSGLILKERIRPVVWLALSLGVIGILVMRPTVQVGGALGSALALSGVGFGTLSIIMARYISRYESNVLAQVFYPNLTLGLVMLCVLPLVWRPMTAADLALVGAYAVLLFGARWLLVLALRQLPAYTVTPLLNLQFVWMALIGLMFFGEVPFVSTYLGMAVVAASGLFLVWDQAQTQTPVRTEAPMATIASDKYRRGNRAPARGVRRNDRRSGAWRTRRRVQSGR
ncbi:protein of unknown function DUF6 transmembrane [Ruegeria sp. TM1040]|jgi:drug/metabolite transporter (DMT)-like permease|uniref:DMT family transporter n=1 Tax=Ruegeria sp. (strain TM1040) TaxID=292414 RepID=UPI00004626CE|nr:DMT family transporter [Ruegeria sp. TM1040]ABF63633.1 protein of unknown function DUF6 transmembrane [Ruegeria sp. TM1040]